MSNGQKRFQATALSTRPVLLGVAESYRKGSADIRTNLERVRTSLRRVSAPPPSDEPVTVELLNGAARDLELFYEPVHGGFGNGPKFPTVPPLDLFPPGDRPGRLGTVAVRTRMGDEGPYNHIYAEFVEKKDRAPGYEFQHAPAGSASPPTVTFAERLKWWSWGRWRRMKRIRAERDRRVEEILEVKNRPEQ